MESRSKQWDDPARFLRELRELRNRAGLGQADLAARAHYPCDVIKAAEAGPALPDLPVLSAYVRGCGGTLAEWEERWRAATGSPASPLSTARAAGCSEAANAGARVGAADSADGNDTDRIMAALNRVAEQMAAPSGADTALLGSAVPTQTVPSQPVSAEQVSATQAAIPAPSPASSPPPGYYPYRAAVGDAATPVHANGAAELAGGAQRAAASPAGPPSATAGASGASVTRRPLPSRTVLTGLVAVILLVVCTVLALVS